MLRRGFDVRVYEPEDSWSAQNLQEDVAAEARYDYRYTAVHRVTTSGEAPWAL